MKHLFSFLLLFCMTAVNAQTILKGDMNDDKDVNIADVTSLVDVVLGKAPKEEINVGGDPYKVDNSLVVGTWVAPDNSSFALNEDGTTTFPDAATYKFRPMQGVLTFYDASENPIKAIVLNEVTPDYLMAVNYATNTFTKYTKQTVQSNHPLVYYGNSDTKITDAAGVQSLRSSNDFTISDTYNRAYYYVAVSSDRTLKSIINGGIEIVTNNFTLVSNNIVLGDSGNQKLYKLYECDINSGLEAWDMGTFTLTIAIE